MKARSAPARPGSPNSGESMSSPKRLARIAGLLYLINGIVAGFAYGFVATKMYVAGDAATTAAQRPGEPGTRPPRGRRRPVPGDRMDLPRHGPLPAAAARQHERGSRDGGPRCRRGRHHVPQRCLRVCRRAGRDRRRPTRPPSAPRGRMPSCCSCSTSSTTGSSSPRSSSACG